MRTNDEEQSSDKVEVKVLSESANLRRSNSDQTLNSFDEKKVILEEEGEQKDNLSD